MEKIYCTYWSPRKVVLWYLLYRKAYQQYLSYFHKILSHVSDKRIWASLFVPVGYLNENVQERPWLTPRDRFLLIFPYRRFAPYFYQLQILEPDTANSYDTNTRIIRWRAQIFEHIRRCHHFSLFILSSNFLPNRSKRIPRSNIKDAPIFPLIPLTYTCLLIPATNTIHTPSDFRALLSDKPVQDVSSNESCKNTDDSRTCIIHEIEK